MMRRPVVFSRAITLAVLWPLVWLVCPIRGLSAQDDRQDNAASSTTARVCLAAEYPPDLNKAYAALLNDASLVSPDTGLALQAAWEEVKHSMPLRPASPVRSRRNGIKKLDRVALARFIGFVEGRLRVRVPGWWGDQLSVAKGRIDEITGLLLLHIPNTESASYTCVGGTSDEGGEFDVYVAGSGPSNVGLKIVEGKAIAHVQRIPLRLTSVPPTPPFYIWTTEASSSTCLVVVNDELPGGELFCVDIKERKVLWKQVLWCDFAPYVRGGAGYHHWSEAIRNDDRVFVFGSCLDVVYIEGFEYATGVPVFRFSTTYGWSREVSRKRLHKRSR